MIEAKGVTKSFGSKRVLRDIDFQAEPGEFVTVFGPNGAGKSTLVQILGGMMRPTAGEIRIAGKNIREDPIGARRSIGLVAHRPFLYDELTAIENLIFYGRMFDVPQLPRRIDEVLRLVGLEFRAHDPVRTFSRGLVQRLAIGRALLHRPSVFLLDEPYSGLDQRAAERFRGILENVKAGGGTILMATHNIQRGLELCQRAVVLVEGRIVFEDDKSQRDVSQFEKIYGQYTAGGVG